MSKDVNNQNYLPDFSVHMAEGFYQVGYSVARSFHEDDKGSDFIFLAPAVVNFNMAVELYLKALHLFLNRRLKSGHHLWELFKSLPPEWKTVIEEKYSIAQASQK